MRRAINIAVSLGVLALALYLLDWTRLAEAFQRVGLPAFVASVALTLAVFLVMAIRWHRIVVKHAPLPFRQHLQIYLYATFLNTFTPGNVGGDVYRLVALRSNGTGMVPTALALVSERLLGLVSYLVGYLVCFALLWVTGSTAGLADNGFFAYGAGAALIAIGAITLAPSVVQRIVEWPLVSRHPKWARVLKQIGAALRFQDSTEAGTLLGLSFLSLILWIAAIQVIANDAGLSLSWLMVGAIAILVELIRFVPISVQGIGVREGAFAYLASLAGASAEAGFIVAAIGYLALSAALLLSGLIAWALMWRANPELSQAKVAPNPSEHGDPR